MIDDPRVLRLLGRFLMELSFAIFRHEAAVVDTPVSVVGLFLIELPEEPEGISLVTGDRAGRIQQITQDGAEGSSHRCNFLIGDSLGAVVSKALVASALESECPGAWGRPEVVSCFVNDHFQVAPAESTVAGWIWALNPSLDEASPPVIKGDGFDLEAVGDRGHAIDVEETPMNDLVEFVGR